MLMLNWLSGSRLVGQVYLLYLDLAIFRTISWPVSAISKRRVHIHVIVVIEVTFGGSGSIRVHQFGRAVFVVMSRIVSSWNMSIRVLNTSLLVMTIVWRGDGRVVCFVFDRYPTNDWRGGGFVVMWTLLLLVLFGSVFELDVLLWSAIRSWMATAAGRRVDQVDGDVRCLFKPKMFDCLDLDCGDSLVTTWDWLWVHTSELERGEDLAWRSSEEWVLGGDIHGCFKHSKAVARRRTS